MTYLSLADRSIDENAWFEARMTGITATEVATLVRGGAGSWAALRAVKNGVRSTYTNRPMQHGVEREPVIAEYGRTEFGLIPSSAVLVDPERPRYLATPDGITVDGSLIGEIKTTIHDWMSWDDVPPRYRDQMLWQMFVTGARHGKLLFEPHDDYIPLYPFPKVFDLDYDEGRVAELVQVADEFLAGDGEYSADDAALDQLITARIEAKERADLAAAEVSDIDDLIRDQLDNKPKRFEGSSGNLTLSADSTSNKFDSKAFEKSDPETYKKFVKASPVKGRLTISVRKENA